MASSRFMFTNMNTLFLYYSLFLLASVGANYAKTDDNCTIEMKEVCTSDATENVCQDEPVEECQTQKVTVYHNEVKQECSEVPESVCEEQKRKHCEVVQKPVRKVILVRECKEVLKTVCDNDSMPKSHGDTHSESKSSSYENLGEHNHDHCEVVLKETCRPVPEEKCEDVTKNVTRTETKEVCERVSVKECGGVQYKNSCNQTYQEASEKKSLLQFALN